MAPTRPEHGEPSSLVPCNSSTSIKHWPSAQRPREKLLMAGAQQLSDAELLAVFLRTGLPGKSAVALAHELLARFGDLASIVAASKTEFCKAKGLGLAKWANLAATSEITRRALQGSLTKRSALTSPVAVKNYLQLWFQGKPYEAFVTLFLDSQHQLIETRELFRGTVNQTAVYPREIVRQALELNASSIVISHNHPSGVCEPSAADRLLTDSIKNAAATVDIRLVDHVIVAGNSSLSFSEKGLL